MKYLNIKDHKILVANYELWAKRAMFSFPVQNIEVLDLITLLKSEDTSEMTITEDDTFVESVSGYGKFLGYQVYGDTVSVQLERLTESEVRIETIENAVLQDNIFEQIKILASVVAPTVPDEIAIQLPSFFDEYQVGRFYKKGDRFIFESKFYKVLQNHESQENWRPDEATGLYVSISDPADPFPEFKQPTGAHDAYMKGDPITFKEKHYRCKRDAVVFSPEDDPTAWEEVE